MDKVAQPDTEQTGSFNKVQSLLFPVHGFELKKFLPMSLLMFCILFVYTMVRDLKDVFIQKYAICGGTELMPVLKLWFVMPAAFLTVMLFTWLISKFGSTKTFYIMVTIFLAFFAIFMLFLFPNANVLHLNATQVRQMQTTWPRFFYYVIPCLTNWSYTLFYIFAEIWGTVAIQSLFWQFANQITKKDEVRRFYGLYALIANMGVILSGGVLKGMSTVSGAAFDNNVKVLIGFCIFFGLATMAIFYYINKVVLTDPRFYNPDETSPKKKKEKISIMKGLKILFTSPYIGLVAVLVLGYGISINLTEVVWKEQMRATLTNSNDYSTMMGNLSVVTGILTVSTTLLSTNVLRRFKWKIGAVITPVVMLVAGAIFFAIVLYGRNGGTHLFGMAVPMLAVWVGLIVNAIIKSIKYCLFDSTKSMAYRPLDEDTKTKGQAAVEVVGGRAGKAGASAINYVLTNIVVVGSKLMTHIYTIIPIFAVTVIAWIMAVFGLGKKYEAKMAEGKSE